MRSLTAEIVLRFKTVLAIFLFVAAAPIALPAQTFTALLSFNGTNGNDPEGAPDRGRR